MGPLRKQGFKGLADKLGTGARVNQVAILEHNKSQLLGDFQKAENNRAAPWDGNQILDTGGLGKPACISAQAKKEGCRVPE